MIIHFKVYGETEFKLQSRQQELEIPKNSAQEIAKNKLQEVNKELIQVILSLTENNDEANKLILKMSTVQVREQIKEEKGDQKQSKLKEEVVFRYVNFFVSVYLVQDDSKRILKNVFLSVNKSTDQAVEICLQLVEIFFRNFVFKSRDQIRQMNYILDLINLLVYDKSGNSLCQKKVVAKLQQKF